ncbi:MAG TPA: class I SAM-dependent RNA methyltransferase [Spirochaetia bacterium]|nr:class I SAM-dependent RNA methyltransferase [Spirochaetia bacterium]
MELIALCPFGLEKLTRDEVKALGFRVSSQAAGKVFFEGGWDAILKANLHLRTAERVLAVLGGYPAADFDQLFSGTGALPWEEWLSPHTTIVVEKVKTYKSKLTSVPAIQAMVQKAVFQRLAGRWGLRSLPQAGPQVGLRVYLEHDRALACVDTTGAALHNRGYRKNAGEAPIKENLAAALLLFSGWRRKYPLYDPLCGSGTILAEALLFAYDIPPGLRRNFSFEHLVPHQPLDWKILVDEGRDRIDTSHRVRVCGSDKDQRVLEAARANLGRLGLEVEVQLEHLSMEEARADRVRDVGEDTGFLVTNPPYGERLNDRPHAENLSRQMRHFARTFPGWKLGVLTSLESFPAQIDLPPYVVRDLVNGSLPVKYYQFQL